MKLAYNKKELLYECRDAVAYLNGNGGTQGLRHNMGMKEQEEDLCSIIIAAQK